MRVLAFILAMSGLLLAGCATTDEATDSNSSYQRTTPHQLYLGK